MALFLDLYPLSQAATNDALELIYKSTHDHDKGIWNAHESVLIRRLIELFTQRGLDRLEHVRTQILVWQSGEHHKAGVAPVAVPGMMTRWSQDELSLVKIYLESLPPGQWSLDDHMMSVDYVVQRYLPADELQAESEWLSTRASMMGKVQANMEAVATAKQADKILAALPSTAAQAASQFTLTEQHKKAMDYGRVRAAENVRAITEEVRHSMRSTILNHIEEQAAGNGGPSLESKLLDKFAALNRDWRRVAVTESGECQLQGLIASLEPGTKVERVEQYANACGFCKKINGRIAEVVSPDAPDKNPETQIWVGKNNIGRSASPRKRVGDALVPRTPDEMWWLPAGVAHPHCRGRWVVVSKPLEEGDDPDFAKWLETHLS